MKHIQLTIFILLSSLIAQEEVEIVFYHTGGVQEWTVPTGVTSIHVDAIGASGEQDLFFGYNTPGKNGRVVSDLNVNPGEILYIYCGGVAISNRTVIGYNGGGRRGQASPFGGGGGGGATDIRIGGTTFEHRVIVAGGGGGAGGGNINGINVFGGDGGGLQANDGNGYGSDSNKGGGKGGTQSTGGSGGFSWASNARDGALGTGGSADYYEKSFIAGGGGGGGYYGGGGGIGSYGEHKFFGGGGGGSSYTDPDLCSNVDHTIGYSLGDGKLTITYTDVRVTYIPDDNFEAYLEANGMGDGVADNNYVLTGNINEVTHLSVANENISDLTGIEDFSALEHFQCFNNQITDIDVSQNINLQYLDCDLNQLTELDVSSLSALQTLHCRNNQISTLDVSNNPELTLLRCYNNQLTELDIRNGNNANLGDFIATGNPNLSCIFVDDVNYASGHFQQIDAKTSFSQDCDSESGENTNNSDGLTYVPDDNFEAYLEARGMGDGVADNNYVLTENIESFTGELTIYNQNISDLTGIEDFTELTHLLCHNNQIESIDVSQNENLIYLLCMNNPPLQSVDLRNGNNHNMNNFQAYDNPSLDCISVDDASSFKEGYFAKNPIRLNIGNRASLSGDCEN